MPTEAQVKKIANSIAKGEERDVAGELTKLAEEKRLFEQMKARQGPGTGWQLVGDKPMPMHRLEIANAPTAALVRSMAASMPLTCRIIPYGGMEWWEGRRLVDLSDEELDSAFIYREAYERQAATGEAPPRPIRATDPDEEPSGGELYQIAAALKEGLNRFRFDDPLKHRAAVLYTNIKDGGTPSQILENTFRFHEGAPIMETLAGIAAVVPEVGRLVTWLEHGEAA